MIRRPIVVVPTTCGGKRQTVYAALVDDESLEIYDFYFVNLLMSLDGLVVEVWPVISIILSSAYSELTEIQMLNDPSFPSVRLQPFA
jgi:hypothetical protein